MNLAEMQEAISQITYKDWRIRLYLDGDRPYLQVSFLEEDMTTKVIEEQKGRKWFLSPHMTKSEVVSTALKAVLTAEEHETREKFRFQGKAIFGPHFDVDQLVKFATYKDNLDMRTGQWVKAA